MLAGRMKLNNFLALLMVGAAAVASGMAVWLSSDDGPSGVVVKQGVDVKTVVPIRPMPVARLDPQNGRITDVKPVTIKPVKAVPAGPAPTAGEAIDGVMRGYMGKGLGGSKKKDVTSGKPYKINVYQDEGHTEANRAKVDLDRDEKWDEKWTFGDDLTRKIAPNDDEVYSVEQIWADGGWQAR